MEYGLMTVSILFSVLNSLLLHKFKNKTFKTPGDAFFFNGGISVVWTVLLFIWNLISVNSGISLKAIVFGIVYGIILCMFLYFKMEAMASGPVSLSTLIGSCAFVIATWFGVVYADEAINVFQLVGMVLILISLLLCVNPKKSAEKLTKRWFINCACFFLAGGFVGILYKVFGRSDVSEQVDTMMLTASVVSAILFFTMGYIVNRVSNSERPTIHKDAVLYIILSGIAGCVYIRLNIPLANLIPSAVFFPVSNGAMVILTTLAGGLLFQERLSGIQKTGIVLGLTAIIVTGCGNYVWQLIV